MLTNENLAEKEILVFIKKIQDFEVIFKRIYRTNENQEFKLMDFVFFFDEILEAYTLETMVKDDNENVVRISTIQKMKGLTKKIVFFSGCSEGIIPQNFKEFQFFPSHELEDFGIRKAKDYSEFLVEEKVLFDLAISRASDKLFISYSELSKNMKNLSISSFARRFEVEDNATEHKKFDYKKKYESDFDFSKIQTEKEYSEHLILNGNNQTEVFDKIDKLDKNYLRDILAKFRYSQASLKNYKECNFLFLLSQLLKLQINQDKVAFEFGKIVHDVLLIFHKKYNHYADISNPDSIVYLKKLVDKYFEQKKYLFECVGEMVWYKDKAAKIFAGLFK